MDRTSKFHCDVKNSRINDIYRHDSGFAHLFVIVIVGMVGILAIAILITIIAGKTAQQTKIDNNPETEMNDVEGDVQSDPSLLGIRQLRCVVLPGVNGMHTRALDVRVARGFWKPAYEEMRSKKIPITINYAFRNVCEQIQATANAGGNMTCQWPRCISPHMMGRAIDVNGVGNTTSGGKSRSAAMANPVLQILLKYGWRWVGPEDWPHFDIQAHQVNDSANYAQWASEIQLFWKRQQEMGGGTLGNCMGDPCGLFYPQMRRLSVFSRIEAQLAAQKQQQIGGSNGGK